MKQNVCETERGLPALKIEYVRSLNQISAGSLPHCKSNRKKPRFRRQYKSMKKSVRKSDCLSFDPKVS